MSKVFSLSIGLGNAAFQRVEEGGNGIAFEVQHVLNSIPDGQVIEAVESSDSLFGGKLRDSNGNTVGRWAVTGPAEYHNSPESNMRAKYPGRTGMERHKMAEVFQLAAIFARLRPDLPPHLVALDAHRLGIIARSLHKHAEALCNREVMTREEKRAEKLGKQAAAIADAYGLGCTTHGDPRGYVVRLHGDVPRNGMGDGFGVG